ncbi:unnamed protein product [Anisakis simplex]|uniref:Protein phosphatase inhibitor 2 (inferred by orthology to a human protein) n=1 Tax=Anisakis simplex TaxID=6269 RepID=A0A0M3JXM0_ANISI|nr:unnamed protein product [Anisakis simplex]
MVSCKRRSKGAIGSSVSCMSLRFICSLLRMRNLYVVHDLRFVMNGEGDEMDSREADSLHKDPSECLKMKPKKSILKQPSMDEAKRALIDDGRAHFDEMNILATHHPADKDYGHMKIDEPKTPYHQYSDSEEESEGHGSRHRRVSLVDAVDPVKLAEGLQAGSSHPPAYIEHAPSDDYDEESELTPEQIAHKREFEKKRKAHYNEGAALRHARELMAKDEENME